MQEMHPSDAYMYAAELEGPWHEEGPVEYFITVVSTDGARTFPGGLQQRPGEWDFVGGPGWSTMIVDSDAPLPLFRARTDAAAAIYPHQERGTRYESAVVTGTTAADAAIRLSTDDLARPPHFLAIGFPTTLPTDVGARDSLALTVRSLVTVLDSLNVTLVLSDGSSWGSRIPVTREWTTPALSIADLRPMPAARLPRAYPFFLPFWFEPDADAMPAAPDLSRLQSVQIGIDARSRRDLQSGPAAYELQEILLK